MIIITDCLTEKVDEGCLKVANSLVNRLKQSDSETSVISYGRQSKDTDTYLKLNKLFLNRRLFTEIRKHSGSILYIPFSSNTAASIFRTWVLSLFSGRKVAALFALQHPMNRISEFLLRNGRFQIVALSQRSFSFYEKKAPGRVLYLKTGVDIQKFHPVSRAEKLQLKQKYGLDPEKPVVLHVGHLRSGRNVGVLTEIARDKQVVLVTSSVSEQDAKLHRQLEQQENIRIIDQYIPAIQELYQLSDVYLFPVVEEENCIDVPLSVLEGAACNIPIVTTAYGELKELVGQPGFFFLETMDASKLNDALDHMLVRKDCGSRDVAKTYDWTDSTAILKAWLE